jgi:hypothetical protein
MARIAIDDGEQDPNSIELYVKKHKVTIKNGIIIYIHHEPTCTKPCPHTKSITDYVVAEGFVAPGSMIVAETFAGDSKK